jgi:hypothetical protein
MKQENGLPFTGKGAAQAYINSHFATFVELNYNAEFIDSFTLVENGRLVERKTTTSEQFLAFEISPGRCYNILNTKNFTAYDWGEKHDNDFFGLLQTLKLCFIDNPPAKGNLLLCDNVLETICYLQVGVPAITVDTLTVWDNVYFKEIIMPTFPNLIITYDKSKVPPNLNEQAQLNFFSSKELLHRYQWDNFKDLFQYIQYEDDFLEPLWDLYKYIDRDELVVYTPSTSFSIIS